MLFYSRGVRSSLRIPRFPPSIGVWVLLFSHSLSEVVFESGPHNFSPEMLALINRILDWFKSLFWKEEMELTLVGLQYSGKTTFVNVIAVSKGVVIFGPQL